MEQIKFTRKKSKYKDGGQAVGCSRENYNAIKNLAEECGLNMTDVANKLLDAALNAVQIEEE